MIMPPTNLKIGEGPGLVRQVDQPPFRGVRLTGKCLSHEHKGGRGELTATALPPTLVPGPWFKAALRRGVWPQIFYIRGIV